MAVMSTVLDGNSLSLHHGINTLDKLTQFHGLNKSRVAQCIADNPSLRDTHAGKAFTSQLQHISRPERLPDFVTFAPRSSKQPRHIIGSFLGPIRSPYATGIFHVLVLLPDEYPMRPPRVRFLTRTYHPWIDEDGRLRADFFGPDWTPCMTLANVLVFMASMLSRLDIDDEGSFTEVTPIPEIARTLESGTREFVEVARSFTEKYATGEMPSDDDIQAAVKATLNEVRYVDWTPDERLPFGKKDKEAKQGVDPPFRPF